ncbi:MAG: CDGSH iron-sulfur domain-containing protein [Alphaproteobacteria bacterium]|nr:CDGSH iron-sulfur domain-containing protein [Alphaproteobacteria bacterium]
MDKSLQNPYPILVEAGKKYFWCACGQSQKQPFCDGAHKGTTMTPYMYEAQETMTVWFCGCKATSTQPLCDGSHTKVNIS